MPDSLLRWSVARVDEAAARLRFELQIEPGWKLYAIDSPASRPLEIVFGDLPEGVSASGFAQTAPHVGYDPNFDDDVRYFTEEAAVEARFDAEASAEPGAQPVRSELTFMLCNDAMCLPLTTRAFTAELDASAVAERSSATAPVAFSEGMERVSLTANDADVAASGGVSVEAGAQGTSAPVTGGTSTSGLGAFLLLGAAGAQQVAANPWVNLALGLAFVVFALALLGLIDLRLSSRSVNAVDGASRSWRGLGGTLLAALAIALVSFSCTAPFVGGLLATATMGGWAGPVLGMAAFALPFVVLAAAPGLLARLPKSGGWMLTFKGALGFVELAAALKFLSNADLVWGLGVLTRPVVIALTMAVAALLAA